MHINRRDLLRASAAGLAVVSMPRFLAACAKGGGLQAAGDPGAPLPDDPFLAWFGIDRALLDRVMTELTARGADFADLYFQHSRTSSVSMEDGIVAKASSGIDQGVGLRVVIGDQVGYAYTEDLTLDAMIAAARTASAIAAREPAAPPQAYSLHDEGGFYRVTRPWSDVGITEKVPLVEKIEAYARALDPTITKASATFGDTDERVLIADLFGNIRVDRRPMSRLAVSVTATRNGETNTNYSNLAGRHGLDWFTEERLQTCAKEAVDRNSILFEAKRPPAGEMPVVLAAGASGILLHEAIGHGMEADFNRKGTSIYSEMIGRSVAPDFVTIVDDGTQEGERGALNVDDEGTSCERTVLVDKGILASYLHDRISAKHYGLSASTGSGRRESFRHTVMPRMRSTYMENGPHTKDEIIATVEKGIVCETFTNGQVQIGAGDFTFFVKNGWLVENGKITAPIRDVNIIGNGPDALKKVTMVANDYKLDTGGWTCGKNGQSVPVSQGIPTVLVSSLTVGGENA